MKYLKYFLVLLSFSFNKNIIGQNKVDLILDYYNSQSSEKIIRVFRENCKKLETGANERAVYKVNYNCDAEFTRWEDILLIYLVLSKDAKNYKSGEDIYKYLEIDTLNFLLLFREEKKIKSSIDESFLPPHLSLKTKGYNQFNRIFNKTMKNKPDAVLYSHSFINKHHSFLFIKGYKIYIVRRCLLLNKPIELNKYVNRTYTETEIRNLSDYSNYFKGLITGYPNKKELREKQ